MFKMNDETPLVSCLVIAFSIIIPIVFVMIAFVGYMIYLFGFYAIAAGLIAGWSYHAYQWWVNKKAVP